MGRVPIRKGPHDDELDGAWDGTLRPFFEAAVDSLSVAEQTLLSLATEAGIKSDNDGYDLPPIDREGLIHEIDEALFEAAAK